MKPRTIALILFACGGVALGLFWLLPSPEEGMPPSLTVYCAAGLKQPVEEIARQYREEFGVEVGLQYGATGTLLAQIEIAKRGDLWLAADDGSVEDGRLRGLVEEVVPFVLQRPVLAVRTGNPKNLQTLTDLTRPGVKLALANPESASISRITSERIGAAAWGRLVQGAAVMKPTVTEIAADLQLGAVDAAILWDPLITQFQELEAIELPELSNHREPASACVLKACAQPREALKFARYLAAPERGGKVFAERGWQLAGGDRWAVKPQMVLYSGGVNRLAIESLLQEFSEREGAEITTVFNGCGILCASMKAMSGSAEAKFPDAYYACDVCFVPPVAEQFPEAVLLTETEIVIAVPKGNPGKVATLADLARPGLRLGLCNAEQSTLGFMTAAVLRRFNLSESVRRNVVVEVPTADFLVNQMRTGSLDAAIVYRVNVHLLGEHFEVIPLPAGTGRAVQPFAVRHDSVNAQLSGRLLTFLRGHASAFVAAGFEWRGDSQAIPSDQLEVPAWLKQ